VVFRADDRLASYDRFLLDLRALRRCFFPGGPSALPEGVLALPGFFCFPMTAAYGSPILGKAWHASSAFIVHTDKTSMSCATKATYPRTHAGRGGDRYRGSRPLEHVRWILFRERAYLIAVGVNGCGGQTTIAEGCIGPRHGIVGGGHATALNASGWGPHGIVDGGGQIGPLEIRVAGGGTHGPVVGVVEDTDADDDDEDGGGQMSVGPHGIVVGGGQITS